METRHYSIGRVNPIELRPKRKFTYKHIIDVVSSYTGVSYDTMCQRNRKREVVLARYYTYYFAKEYTKMTLKGIGTIYRNHDHTTVIHGINAIKDFLDVDKKVQRDFSRLSELMKNKYIETL